MSRRGIAQRFLGGQPGELTWVDSEWVGWSGLVAHPDSPAGGGGPGHFSRVSSASRHTGELGSPWRPGAATPHSLHGTRVPACPNAAPVTAPRSLGTLLSRHDKLFQVEVNAAVIRDGTGAETGTSFGNVTWTWRVPLSRKEQGPLEHATTRLVWKTTLEIQTVYVDPRDAGRVSCYGRGTTAADVQARNVTLGFHESCHRADFISYLMTHPLPALPELRVGMTWEEFDSAKQGFDDAATAYFRAMELDSETPTDEVGHPKSAWLASGRTKCFAHASCLDSSGLR